LDSNDKVLNDFGEEWDRFNFLDEKELASVKHQFLSYINPLPTTLISRKDLVIADFGAGTGRWSYFFKDLCKRIYVLEPSTKAFEVCRNRFHSDSRVVLLNQSIEENFIDSSSLDLAVSLGVLHHIPNTQKALDSIQEKLRPGGYFLGYLYYALENKPLYYKLIWRMSDLLRRFISHLPKTLKFVLADVLALLVYFPLAKFSKLLSRLGFSSDGIPLHHYSNLSYKVMRNDALDRFGTSLEKRFTKEEIRAMLSAAGFDVSTLVFSEHEPFWTFSVRKSSVDKGQ